MGNGKPGLVFQMFRIWPESDGSRPDVLRIEKLGGKCLVLTSYYPKGFRGVWDAKGWVIEDKVFGQLTPKETEILRSIGLNLPSASDENTAPILIDRVRVMGGAREVEKTFKKVFKLCQREVRRMQRPRLLKWLPI